MRRIVLGKLASGEKHARAHAQFRILEPHLLEQTPDYNRTSQCFPIIDILHETVILVGAKKNMNYSGDLP